MGCRTGREERMFTNIELKHVVREVMQPISRIVSEIR
jgi:hypothetical protein